MSDDKEKKIEEEGEELSKIEALEKKVEELGVVIEQLKEDKIRLFSNFDNARKNLEKRLEESVFSYKSKILSKFLSLDEDFQLAIRALNFTDDSQNLKNFFSGFLMIKDALLEVIKNEGVEEYLPELHQEWNKFRSTVVAQEESDQFQPGLVLEVISKGYVLNSRVLVYAKVKISKKKESE